MVSRMMRSRPCMGYESRLLEGIIPVAPELISIGDAGYE
jgi:hypothetical protein